MGRDRSLDEFFGGDGDADDDEDGSETPADRVASDPESDGSADAEGTNPDPDADTDAEADAGTVAGTDADGGESALPDAAAVDPAEPTYRWAPGGAACESCGTAVERRWIDGGAFVCDDCKEW